MSIIVNNKIGSALICEHRQLRDGEMPKETGRTTVYEATGELNPEFKQALKDGLLEATWKIDGTCCFIKGGKLYRRFDIRDGKAMPEGALPGEEDENGIIKICWLLVNGSIDPQDICHLSALAWQSPTTINGFWTLNEELKPTVCAFTDEELGTYELIGPRVGPNPYLLEEVEVTMKLMSKGVLKDRVFPRHYLVRHGEYKVRDFPTDQLLASKDPVELFRNMIQSNKVEGIVFRHLHDPKIFFKVNQGHIGGAHRPKQRSPKVATFVLWPDRLVQ